MADENSNLTLDQKQFLNECLKDFANRYTNEDKDYKRACEKGIPDPPIISPWYGRPYLTAVRRVKSHPYARRNDRNDRNHDYRNNESNRHHNQ